MDDIERKYKRVRITLSRNKILMALSPIMMVGTQTIDDTTPTACTDGINERYGRRFLAAIEEKPLGFVILHETYHKMCRHIVTYHALWKLDPKRANAACDYWINLILDKLSKSLPSAPFEMPRWTEALLAILTPEQRKALDEQGIGLGSPLGLLDYKYEGMTVKQIFDALKDEGKGGKGKGGDKSDGFDDHDWENGNAPSEEEQEERRKDVERALREGEMLAKKYGSGSTNAELGFDELLKPKVDWRAQLRDFVRTTCRKLEQSTWRRPNRRFLHQGIVMPTMQGKQIKELAMCVDASGSMFGGDPSPFQRVMTEVDGLVKQLGVSKLHVIYWDGYVCAHETYTPATVGGWLKSTKPRGGGGTNPACISPWLKEKGIKPDAAVVLTDGEVPEWGQWTVPVLFAVTGKATANVGKTIHIVEN